MLFLPFEGAFYNIINSIFTLMKSLLQLIDVLINLLF
jgi:DNA anti-recombination protein RmuC